MPPLLKIRSERDQMSAIERRIADFLLENSHLLRDYSSQQVADALKISQSSVVKFSQKLGFKGYPDLKFSIGEAVARANGNETTRVERTTRKRVPPTESLWLGKTRAEEETRIINPAETLATAAVLFDSAGKVFVFGAGEEGSQVQSFANKVAALGVTAVAQTDAALMTAHVASVEPGDVLCVIAEHGKAAVLTQLCKQFRERRGKIVSITRNTSNALRLQSDVALLVSAHDDRPEIEALLYQSMLQHVLDLLFLSLCEADDARLKRWQASVQRAKQLHET
jgi:DNA-binding MurR/RpiR family transcriptional regulator